jgi:hypothetical protein
MAGDQLACTSFPISTFYYVYLHVHFLGIRIDTRRIGVFGEYLEGSGLLSFPKYHKIGPGYQFDFSISVQRLLSCLHLLTKACIKQGWIGGYILCNVYMFASQFVLCSYFYTLVFFWTIVFLHRLRIVRLNVKTVFITFSTHSDSYPELTTTTHAVENRYIDLDLAFSCLAINSTDLTTSGHSVQQQPPNDFRPVMDITLLMAEKGTRRISMAFKEALKPTTYCKLQSNNREVSHPLLRSHLNHTIRHTFTPPLFASSRSSKASNSRSFETPNPNKPRGA